MSKKQRQARQRQARQAAVARKRLVIVGGGAIGSHAVPLAGRLADVSHITLVDGDVYSQANLFSQSIDPADVGRPKVDVLARRLRRQTPGMTVEPIFDWVEHVPLGRLRADAVLCCVDSLNARRLVNERAWRLGVPLIDSGVDGFNWLARTNIYYPGPDRPCLQCAWTPSEYAAQHQVYACESASSGAAATNAPASLGAIAGALLISMCQQFLNGDLTPESRCRQVLWDCLHHRCLETTYQINRHCRFDHQCWEIRPLAIAPEATPLGEFIELLGGGTPETPLALQVAGQSFVSRLICPSCGRSRNGSIYLDRALSPARRRCRECGDPMSVSGFHALEWLAFTGQPSRRLAARTLSSIGFRTGDIVTTQRGDRRCHVEFVAEGDAPHNMAADAAGGC